MRNDDFEVIHDRRAKTERRSDKIRRGKQKSYEGPDRRTAQDRRSTEDRRTDN